MALTTCTSISDEMEHYRSSNDHSSKESSIQVSDGVDIAAVRVGNGGHVIVGWTVVLVHNPLVGDSCLVLHRSIYQISAMQWNEAATDLQVGLKC